MKEIAATMYGVLEENGTVTISKSIVNQTLYKENKTDVRNDMAEFENAVFAQEESK